MEKIRPFFSDKNNHGRNIKLADEILNDDEKTAKELDNFFQMLSLILSIQETSFTVSKVNTIIICQISLKELSLIINIIQTFC